MSLAAPGIIQGSREAASGEECNVARFGTVVQIRL